MLHFCEAEEGEVEDALFCPSNRPLTADARTFALLSHRLVLVLPLKLSLNAQLPVLPHFVRWV